MINTAGYLRYFQCFGFSSRNHMASRLGASSTGGLFSVTRFGKLAQHSATSSEKEYMRLSSQRYIRQDKEREKVYSMCRKCGNTRMTVNWDRIPSARIGLWGTCVNGLDYRHHAWIPIKESEYQSLKPLERRDRLNHYIFDLQDS